MASIGQLVTGSLTANGAGLPFLPVANRGFDVFITGTFSATVTLKRSFDNGVTFYACPKPDLTDAAFTAPINFIVEEPALAVIYDVEVSNYVSGTINYRFQQ